MTNEKLSAYDVRKLLAERTQGDWVFHKHKEDESLMDFGGTIIVVDGEHAGWQGKGYSSWCYIEKQDAAFIAAAPQIAEQYIELYDMKLEGLRNLFRIEQRAEPIHKRLYQEQSAELRTAKNKAATVDSERAMNSELTEENKRLVAENERLRGALETISEACYQYDLVDIADEALKVTP